MGKTSFSHFKEERGKSEAVLELVPEDWTLCGRIYTRDCERFPVAENTAMVVRSYGNGDSIVELARPEMLPIIADVLNMVYGKEAVQNPEHRPSNIEDLEEQDMEEFAAVLAGAKKLNSIYFLNAKCPKAKVEAQYFVDNRYCMGLLAWHQRFRGSPEQTQIGATETFVINEHWARVVLQWHDDNEADIAPIREGLEELGLIQI